MILRPLMTWTKSQVNSSLRRFSWRDWPATDVEEELEQRHRFWELERLRESVLDYDSLSDQEKAIHEAHRAAVRRGHFTYEDPAGGGIVETRYKHFLTGLCCGNACRHCTFNFYNVPKYLKTTKTFNSSFWTDCLEAASIKEPTLNLKQFSLRKLDRKEDYIGSSLAPENT